ARPCPCATSHAHLLHLRLGDAPEPRRMSEKAKHSTHKHANGLHLSGLSGMFRAAKLQAIR
ncbi:MAG: hypothetical protein ABF752_07650, partial [Acetobacter fabarum]|uniref:hypothetical protein n=1 Tax=Acetobacter fabarum TaxID=483199 RepID=UPI0039EAE811